MGAGEEDQEKSADTIPANFLKLIYCENLFCVSYNAEMASDGFQTIAELFQMTADSSQIIADDSQMISGNIQNKKYNTMITGSNLLAEYSRISQNILPKELQQEEFDSLAEDFDLMNEDEDISKYVDTFIELLNDVPEKQTSKPQSTFIRQDVTAEVLKKAEEREAGGETEVCIENHKEREPDNSKVKACEITKAKTR